MPPARFRAGNSSAGGDFSRALALAQKKAQMEPVGEAELPENRREMRLDGRLRDVELARDVLVASAVRDEPRDLTLPRREAVKTCSIQGKARRVIARSVGMDLFEEPDGHTVFNPCRASPHGLDGLAHGAILPYVASGSRL